MGARYLTDLAEVLRSAGMTVVEVDGWQNRSRNSGGYDGGRPWVIMWHHTASQTSAQNDVSYIVYGSPDSPIANLYLARDGAVWICAAGATNTNGKGGPISVSRGTVPLDQMNTHAIGIEAGNSGLGEPWPQPQIDAYFQLNNVLAAAYDLLPDDCVTHQAWAPGRKIDPATAAAVQGPWQPSAVSSSGTWSLDDVRDECWLRATEPPPEPPEPPPPEDTDMPITFVAAAPNYATVLVAIDGAGTSVLAFASEEDRATITEAAGNPSTIHISEGQMAEIMARAARGAES